MHHEAIQEACLHTDGSFIRVIDPDKDGGSTQAGLWGYTVAELGAYFRVTKDESFGDTRAQLKGRQGPVMTDGYLAYQRQKVAGDKQATTVIVGDHLHGWAHARRPLEQSLRQDGDKRAVSPLRLVQSLYAFEAGIKKSARGNPQDVALLRAARAEPMLDRLFDYLRDLNETVTPKSRLGRALSTFLRREAHPRLFTAR